MIYRSNPTLPNPSNSTAFIPFYFTHPTLPPYTTLPNLSNSTPLISLYPTQHATISHISYSTSTVLFYTTNTDLSQPSYSTSPIPLYPIQYKTRTKITNANKNYKREYKEEHPHQLHRLDILIVAVTVIAIFTRPAQPHLSHSTIPVPLDPITPSNIKRERKL